ncbi:hypothetical protein TPHA_0B00200 [Tetrapisispora phaffii CBS 4417]|uniref:FAD-binding FR-type domain-containing protein n=1 Tax=Tetrapisispora phaffii (strain ATCC 24235 / CBS 4417 / NBRC 1672 / NRRL Y-8282 / UCD 70-5) TaxID=1071381 RepID=G8BQ95_TETPH|nr:hypothetical protein TPHA_0B00200 [Tetrapisispora phaffii CBS 4417]CCE61692.1 hypothetical protein TPHA_0B00200 [Tetrapisispora phaffii CBS 4417]
MLLIAFLLIVNSIVAFCDEKIPLKTARKDVWEHNAVASCAAHLNTLNWGFDHEHTAYYALICQYPPAFDSWAMCIQDMINLEVTTETKQVSTFEKSLLYVQVLCSYVDKRSANISLEQYYFGIENGTKFLADIASIEDNTDEIFYHPIKVSVKKLRRLGHAYHGFSRNLDTSQDFGLAICFYFAFVITLISIINFLNFNAFKLLFHKYKLINKFRGRFIIPTLFHKHADYFTFNRYITGLLPTSCEAMMLCGYLILHLIVLFISYEFDPYNIIFKSRGIQVARYFADRTGILAFAHFPLIILFSVRNNLFMHLTGFTYSTFVTLHKWIGRMMILDAMLHGISYSVYAMLNQTFISSNKLSFWRFGVAAIFFGCIIIIMSFGFLRKHYYETFLYTHILMASLFFYSCWKHVEHIGWKDWIISAMVIWITERIFRIARIITFGFPIAKLQTRGEDMIHINIPKNGKQWHCEPGQYVFAYFMDPLIFWQSHPFTVMDLGNEIIIIIKAKTGLTRRLHKKINDAGGNYMMKVSLEGPYGSSAHVHRFDNILIYAGGSGIPGPLMHAIELSKKFSSEMKKRIKLIISARELSFLLSYKNQLFMLENTSIEVLIYITKPRAEPIELDDLSLVSDDYGSRDSVSIFSNSVSEFEQQLSTFATFHNGRPNTTEILKEEFALEGSLAILACTPPAFVDGIRNSTAQLMIYHPEKVVHYFEEYQVW